ncbi:MULTISPECIES: hypothetical protein [Staphylococcus]|uniref:hypothetical protein n=1 Tax=Staphylococcus TaxID=1279 RepID=UPI00069FC1B8|nr:MULTISPECIES: hypothetical protein [Staphylococcus]MCH4432214.1 hypothetical protein [Staphylococcus haemolyticus]OFP08198.1 hypothetical protein HMPREF3003_06920 [Staphylococcus sp. HMSC078B01]
MNKYIETFLTSIAAIVLYKTLIKVYEHFKYKPDEVDTAPNDFPSLEDQIDLNRTFRRQIEKDIATAFEDVFNSGNKEDN